jgi:hypothetical protein
MEVLLARELLDKVITGLLVDQTLSEAEAEELAQLQHKAAQAEQDY